jgi:hypothetical protein
MLVIRTVHRFHEAARVRVDKRCHGGMAWTESQIFGRLGHSLVPGRSAIDPSARLWGETLVGATTNNLRLALFDVVGMARMGPSRSELRFSKVPSVQDIQEKWYYHCLQWSLLVLVQN